MRRPSLMLMICSIAWALSVLPGSSLAAEELGAPTYPRPPSEADCRTFQTQINDWFREAQSEVKQCQAQGRSCPTPVAKVSYGSGRVGQIAACFTAANQRSAEDQVIRFLRNDRYDATVAAMGKSADRARKLREEILSLEAMRRDLANYSALKDDERIKLNTSMAARINETANGHPLSRELTGRSLDYVATKHKEALELFDAQMKEIITAHRNTIVRGALYAKLSQRLTLQKVRSANAEALNDNERAALQAERIERDRESERLTRLARERREAEVARREREIEAQLAAEREQQEQIQEVFSVFMSALGAAAGAYQGAGATSAAPAYRASPTVPQRGGGGSGGVRCPAMSERNPSGGRC